jgi:pimeloyl-ACP methyl ester carboxylesterase
MTALVLLPGMDGTGTLLGAFLAALQPSVEPIVVAYPAEKALDYSALEHIARSSLPIGRPFVLLGESFSGPIAISLASTSPAGLAGLILCCSFARTPWPVSGVLRPLIRLLPASALPACLLSWLLLGRFSSPELRFALRQALARVSSAALRSRLSAVLNVDVSQKLRRLSVPLLYLRPTKDRLVPRGAARLVSRMVPGARVVEVAAPHLLLQAVPLQAAAIVNEFISEVTKSSNPAKPIRYHACR